MIPRNEYVGGGTGVAAPRAVVFLEHSGHSLTNLGDVAMLQAAVDRLSAAIPAADLRVPTSSPERLAGFCPQAGPLSTGGIRTLGGLGYLPGHHRLPGPMVARVEKLEARLRGWRPDWLDSLALRRAATGSRADATAREILTVLDRSVLFVAGGGGYLTDIFAEKAWSSLTLLRRAQQRGVPTALVSQGFGPLTDPALRALAARVLRRADVVALRERVVGPALLTRLGVDPARVMVTGDDAVAASYAARRPAGGAGLGINLRSAWYAGLASSAISAVGSAIRRLAAELDTTLVPVPIALDAAGSDTAAIRQAVGEAAPAETDPAQPLGAVARVARCRVVVTASYHAAVFALAQGIPAVGIARTPYYADKFGGLAELFGTGAAVVRLEAPNWQTRLDDTVRELWSSAAERRAGLLAAAAEQIRWQEEAYARIARLVGVSVAQPRAGGSAEASA